MSARVAVIPGDGIGPEVVPVALGVTAAAFDVTGRELPTFDYLPWGSQHYLETGRMMPSDGLDVLAAYDAIYFGAVGSALVPDHVTVWELILPIRQTFDQYVNVRPARVLHKSLSPLRGEAVLDVVIVRENSEGEYSGAGGRVHVGTPDEVAIQSGVFTRRAIERVVEYAFALAATRPRRRVASATKSNAWAHAMTLWDEVCMEVAARHPEIEFSKYHVDALAARFVTAPGSLDVVVCSNLFGDILSDLAAALSGGLGIAGSANLDPTRRHPSMFEPVHGSAPDIAGTDCANPFGGVWACALMLDHLGCPEEASLLLAALELAASSPSTRTGDLGGEATTRACGGALERLVRSSAEVGAP